MSKCRALRLSPGDRASHAAGVAQGDGRGNLEAALLERAWEDQDDLDKRGTRDRDRDPCGQRPTWRLGQAWLIRGHLG